MECNKKTSQGLLTLLGGILIHICLGTVYTFGSANIYIFSYFRYKSGMTALTPGDTTALMAAQFSLMALSMPLGGYLVTRIGPQFTCLIGAAMVVASTSFAALCLQSWAAFCAIYGALYGAGLGIAYTAPLIACLSWFPKQKGLISGLITAGFGSGSVIFSPLQLFIMNPEGLAPDTLEQFDQLLVMCFSQPGILNNVPKMFRYISLTYGSLLCIGILLLSPAKSNAVNDVNCGVIDQPRKHCKFYKSLAYWLLLSMFTVAGLGVLFMATFWKGLAAMPNGSNCMTETEFAVLASFISATNAFGRIFWGKISDIAGWKMTMMTMSGLWSLSTMILSFSNTNKYLYGIICCIAFCCLGGNFSLFPSATIDVFGPDGISDVYGFVFLGQMISSVFMAIVSPFLLQLMNLQSFCILIASTMLVPGMIIAVSVFVFHYEWQYETEIPVAEKPATLN